MRMELERVSRHAVERYIERVDPRLDARQAAEAIREIWRSGRARPRPRWWSSRMGERPGTRYVYSAADADVCLIAAGRCVVTVQSRAICHEWRGQEQLAHG